MQTVLKRLATEEDHTLYDCFVCCILSHGGTDEVSGVNNKSVSLKKITSYFTARKCTTLAGKPKLFFIQTCQGNKKMKGISFN
jgi:caspase 10